MPRSKAPAPTPTEVAAICVLCEARTAKNAGMTAGMLRMLARVATMEQAGAKVLNTTLAELTGEGEQSTAVNSAALRRAGLIARKKGKAIELTSAGRLVLKEYARALTRDVKRLRRGTE